MDPLVNYRHSSLFLHTSDSLFLWYAPNNKSMTDVSLEPSILLHISALEFC